MSGDEEALTPAFSSSMGVNEDKAKALFERYGLKCRPRTPAQTDGSAPTSKIRRVEKPVRIRIHWTCHQCARQFGHDRACANCGHRRCGDCSRSPPKKVKAILEEAKQAQIAQERTTADKSQILAAISPNTVAAPAQSSTAAATNAELEVDEKEELDAPQYAIEKRPSSGIKLVLRSKVVMSTGHGATKFEPTMVASVQRVYRKPRQRVRWTCDRCDTVLADSHRCQSCHHQRCATCVRSP